MRFFLIDRLIQVEGFYSYIYNMHNIEEKNPWEVLKQEFRDLQLIFLFIYGCYGHKKIENIQIKKNSNKS